MAQLPQRLGFDLANAFAHNGELPDFFQRVLGAVFAAEAHLDPGLEKWVRTAAALVLVRHGANEKWIPRAIRLRSE